MTQQRYVANTGSNEQQGRTDEDQNCGRRREDKSASNKAAVRISAQVPYAARLVLLREVKRVKRESVDGLTRSVSEQETLPA